MIRKLFVGGLRLLNCGYFDSINRVYLKVVVGEEIKLFLDCVEELRLVNGWSGCEIRFFVW